MTNGADELLADKGMGVHLFILLGDFLVIGEEFALEDAETVELVEEVCGSAKRVGERVLRTGGNVAIQYVVGTHVVLVVHVLKRGVDAVGLDGAEGGNAQNYCKCLNSQNECLFTFYRLILQLICGAAPQL